MGRWLRHKIRSDVCRLRDAEAIPEGVCEVLVQGTLLRLRGGMERIADGRHAVVVQGPRRFAGDAGMLGPGLVLDEADCSGSRSR